MKLTERYFKLFEGVPSMERRHIVSVTLDGLSEIILGLIFPPLRQLSIFSLLGLSLVALGIWHYIVCRVELWMKKETEWISLSN